MWSERSWVELPHDLERVGRAAILPVGATEQHGPHLGAASTPFWRTACARRRRNARRCRCCRRCPMAARSGIAGAGRAPYAVQPVTLIHFVKDIGDWAYHSGVRRLFIVNTHVTNAAPLRCALELLRSEHDDLMVALINSATLSARVRAVHFADAEDWHANDAETSLMLEVAPELVRKTLVAAADDPDRTTGWCSRIPSIAPAATASRERRAGRARRRVGSGSRGWWKTCARRSSGAWLKRPRSIIPISTRLTSPK